MIPAPSPLYLEAIRHTHQAYIEVELRSATHVTIGELQPISVNLSVDGTAQVRRTAEVTVGIDEYGTISRDTLEKIAVDATEVVIRHGIAFDNNIPEMVTVATLRIAEVTKVLTASQLSFQAFDRAVLLAEHVIDVPIYALHQNYHRHITDLVAGTLPGEAVKVGARIDKAANPGKGKAIVWGADRLAEIQQMAEACGGWLYNEPDGSFTLDAYDPAAAPVWRFDHGKDGVLIEATQAFNRQDQFNAVGIHFTPTGDADWGNVQEMFAIAWDDDPNSPTYWEGPFGKKPLMLDEEYDYVPTKAEAEALCRRKLNEYIGQTRSLQIQAVYNPLLLPGDRVTVSLPGQADEVHTIDRIQLSLGTQVEMVVDTRMVRTP